MTNSSKSEIERKRERNQRLLEGSFIVTFLSFWIAYALYLFTGGMQSPYMPWALVVFAGAFVTTGVAVFRFDHLEKLEKDPSWQAKQQVIERERQRALTQDRSRRRERKRQKNRAWRRKQRKDAREKILKFLATRPDGEIKSAIKNETKVYGETLNRTLRSLEADGSIEKCRFYKNGKTHNGYRLSKPNTAPDRAWGTRGESEEEK